MYEFAFQMDILRLLVEWHANIGVRKNRDRVSGLQLDVLARIAFKYQFAQVERHQRSLEVIRVKPLDHRVIPVDVGSS